MLLLRCLTYLFVGMAAAIVFLGEETGETAMSAPDAIADVPSRSVVSPAAAPLAASPAEEFALPDLVQDVPAALPGPAAETRAFVPGTPVTFYPAPRPLGHYARRDAPADMRSPGADAAGEGGTLLYVAASRVNLRAGPGTDRPVVASLRGGTEAEPIGPAEDGWQRVRIVSTGEEGYMADRFLTSQRP